MSPRGGAMANYLADSNKVKQSKKSSKGVSTVALTTVRGDKTFTWFDQHSPFVCKDDKKIDGSGCATCATIAACLPFINKDVTPYGFRHNDQLNVLGSMGMPWDCQACVKVVRHFGLRAQYYAQTSYAECQKLIKEHLSSGMPVIAWVWYKDRNGKVNKGSDGYTNYAHVVLLAGITKDDRVIILDSGARGPLRIKPLKHICNYILPGKGLNGFILVYPDILYRVRKSWADVESQVGAYAVLENAKAEVERAHNFGETYTVYDNNGQAVYPYYRVRKDPHDTETQVGSFAWFKNAVAECSLHPGWHVVNIWDEVLMTATDAVEVPVVVKIAEGVDIYDLKDLHSNRKSNSIQVNKDGKYTITEITKVNDEYYGRLKSGMGWVCMDDVRANL